MIKEVECITRTTRDRFISSRETYNKLKNNELDFKTT